MLVFSLFSALSTAFALIVYPVALTRGKEEVVHSYGFGYGLAWVVAALYVSSAICMCLDELARFAAKTLCRRCMNRDSNV